MTKIGLRVVASKMTTRVTGSFISASISAILTARAPFRSTSILPIFS